MFKLSIIIPIYNVEEYIADCLDSFLMHLDPSVQVICINDGSPDQSMATVEKIVSEIDAPKQSQFLLINQENKGLSEARNTGIDAASGEYLAFLDSDDMLYPEYFQEILRHLSTSGPDIIDFHLMTSDNHLIKTNQGTLNSVFSLMNWFCPGRVFKASLFDQLRFTPEILYEDLDLTPKLYLEANSILHLDKPLYWYRVNTTGITKSLSHANNIKTIDSLKIIFSSYYSLYSSTLNPYYAIPLIQCYYLICVGACRRFNINKGLFYFKKYKNQMSDIELKDLPIFLEILNPRIKAFYKHPRTYLLVYSIYNRARLLASQTIK